MHLKSITLKGFKSFPDRTRLEFGSGVSVIVGPNGSGKSNITDAVLWALGEQSPIAVRGQTMQDVIFAGGAGARSRSSCDVEVVIDNSDGSLSSEFSEISIARHIDRSGEGVYRLNGARCRLVDVIEVLSDSGLGKEMHSVISQGRVEQIIHSKPYDRTALIEEAAGLSKHRKRRRRAQLKLERTQDNLSRALDIEREARSHLRPLKRQAEAAELHARVERQSLELCGQLTHDTLLAVRAELAEAERGAGEARRSRDRLEAEQGEVGRRREQTERGLAEHGKERERLSSRLFATRSAAERIAIRLESVKGTSEAVDARLERSRKAIEAMGEGDGRSPGGPGASGLEALEAELNRLDTERDARLAVELQGIERERQDAERRAAELGEQIESRGVELDRAERAADEAREHRRRTADQAEEAARKRAALELELASIVERQQLVAGGDGPSLAQKITAERGFEAALAAALGGRLTALLVEDLRTGAQAIERSAPEGARALVKKAGSSDGPRTQAPSTGAQRLIEHVSFEPEVRALVERLLDDAWVVDRIEDVADDFEGIAVTRAGIAYRGHVGEVRRLPVGGAERVLAERSRRGQIEAELELIAADAKRDGAETEQVTQALRDSEESCESLQAALRELRRAREEALEEARRAGWLSERRRELGSGPDDTRRAELMGEIAAERRLAESLSRERSERQTRRRRLEAAIERDRRLLPQASRLGEALERALEATHERRAALEQELSADEAVGERAAAELRRLAQSEYELQARLREASELLTQEEVRVAQIRDRETATGTELGEISKKLGQDASGEQPLTVTERAEIEARLERLERRRERIGPVNPLAEGEYQDALEHVEDLERQRKDLEAALAELEGLIRETDRRIRESFHETFEVTARHFEDVIQHLFPGGRGRLRLVKPPQPRVVLGGVEAEPAEEEANAAGSVRDPEAAMIAGDPATDDEPRETPGVEIEVTPAGKSTKRLSLLSGGEKSLVALGFLFAVFLARPCPFYILDEVEAALDDLNIDRFLRLVRGYADRSQFIVITHQRRTMEAADVLYGVSMGGDGVSKVVSRRLESEPSESGEPLTEAA